MKEYPDIEKLETHISGFDLISCGGLPKGRTTLVAGTSGSAKTVFAAQFLAAAEKQGATALRMIGHRIAGTTFLYTGDIVEGRAHFDHALALYDPVEHRPLTTRFPTQAGFARQPARRSIGAGVRRGRPALVQPRRPMAPPPSLR